MTWLPSSNRIALAAILLAGACSQSRDVTVPKTVAVPTEVVRVTEVPEVRITTGTVRSATVSSLASKVLGNVTRVLVNEGDRVRAGQILLEIDDRDVRAKSEQARAASRAIEQASGSASAAIEGAQANANLADATYKRFAALRERGSVSPQEFEEVAAKQKAARAELERAQRGRDQLLAQHAQALAAVAEAETFLSYTVIRSPIDGLVSARSVDPGAQAAPGMPLLTVEDAKTYRVETTVDEQVAAEIHVGQDVTVEGIHARIAHIAPIDAATRSALVKIDLPQDAALPSGTFTHVTFAIGRRNALTVPAGALARYGQLASVFVIDEHGTARMRLVTLGDTLEKRVEVLSGVDAGERIVSVAAGIRDGMQVRGAS